MIVKTEKPDYNNNKEIAVKKVKYKIRPVDVEEYVFHQYRDGSIHIHINGEYLGYVLDSQYARHILTQLSDEFEDCPFTMVLIKEKQQL